MDKPEEFEKSAEVTGLSKQRRLSQWKWVAIAGGVILILLVWLFSASPAMRDKRSDIIEDSSVAKQAPPESSMTYALRSNVEGASFTRSDNLSTVTPYGDPSNNYCGDRIQPVTSGGQLASQRGWRVVQEEKYHGLDAVLVVRGYDPGTSGRCFSKDAKVAFFNGNRLIGTFSSRGENGIQIDRMESINGHLRIWNEVPNAQGQISMDGSTLTFDTVTGSDEVCDGKYHVPAVFDKNYSQARKILGRAGWMARPSTEEMVEDRTKDYRDRFPEADMCSGTGYARCIFELVAKDGVAKLSITTYGEDEDPPVATYEVSCGAQTNSN